MLFSSPYPLSAQRIPWALRGPHEHSLRGPHKCSENPMNVHRTPFWVSCIFNGFLNILFIGYSLLLRRDQVSLPSFQEELPTWHLPALPTLPPLSSNIAWWGHIREKESLNLRLTGSRYTWECGGWEKLHKSIFLTSIQLCRANWNFIYLLVLLYKYYFLSVILPNNENIRKLRLEGRYLKSL